MPNQTERVTRSQVDALREEIKELRHENCALREWCTSVEQDNVRLSADNARLVERLEAQQAASSPVVKVEPREATWMC